MHEDLRRPKMAFANRINQVIIYNKAGQRRVLAQFLRRHAIVCPNRYNVKKTDLNQISGHSQNLSKVKIKRILVPNMSIGQ